MDNSNLSLNPDQPAQEPVEVESDLSLEMPMSVWPFAGVFWQPTPWLRLGATYRNDYHVKVDINVDADIRLADFVVDLEDLARLAPDLFPLKAVVSIDIPQLSDDPLEIPIEISGISGELTVSARVPLDLTMEFVDNWKPQQVAIGAAVNPTERLLVSLDAVWYNWSRYPKPDLKLEVEDVRINVSTLPATVRGQIQSIMIPVLGTIGPLPPVDISIPQIDLSVVLPLDLDGAYDPRAHDIICPRLGLEYRFPPIRRFWILGDLEFSARTGYSYEPSPFEPPNGYNNLIDNDRHVATAGMGLSVNRRYTVDLFGQYHYLEPLKADRDHIDERYPYQSLEASGYILVGGASVGVQF